MAGYSGTPLLKKLGIKEGHYVLVKNPPARLPEELEEYANAQRGENLDVALFFADSVAVLNAGLPLLLQSIKSDGMIWIAWPKKSSGVKTDLTENLIRDRVLQTPLVDIKVCAIDETWSGLKFVIRKELRAAFAANAK